MADVATTYTLNTGSTTIVFNDGSADQFYITEIQGIDGLIGNAGSANPPRPFRRPQDPVPFASGTILYAPFAVGYDIHIEGIFLITSTRTMNGILDIRNDMEAELANAIGGLAFAGNGTLTWLPYGQSVTNQVSNLWMSTPLTCPHDQGYLVRTFSFGLFSGDA